jgi:hypothetical protein
MAYIGTAFGRRYPESLYIIEMNTNGLGHTKFEIEHLRILHRKEGRS